MNPLSAKPLSPAAAATEPRVLVALTRRECALFFGAETAPRGELLDEAELTSSGWIAGLERRQPQVLVTGWNTPPLPEAWLLQPDCPLQYVCHVAGSVRTLVPRAFIARGGIVTNWGDHVSRQVAEHGLLLALAALRRAGSWREFVARDPAARRIEDLATRTLFGQRVGLHGFGAVARALLPLLAPFSVSVAAFSAGVPPELMRAAGVRPCVSLEELFSGSDVLFECEALTPATEQSVSAQLLARLPDDAVFVNVARGRLVDDAALQREARSGRLRVALDVVSDEPLTATSPYVTEGHVILSPHIGGPTLDRYQECGRLALMNLDAFLHGRTPPAAISLAAYDRAT